MSFLLDAIHAANDGVYEVKEFLRNRCRIADAEINIGVGEGVQSVAVQCVEGISPSCDNDVWRLIENMSAASMEINRDGGEVTITVEFD
jgi:hypothetical protein